MTTMAWPIGAAVFLLVWSGSTLLIDATLRRREHARLDGLRERRQ